VTDPTGSGGLRGGGGGAGYATERADVCLEVATVTEDPASAASASSSVAASGGGQRRSMMVCGGDRRVIHAFVTRGHRVRVRLHNPRMVNSIGMFLLQYSGQLISFC